MLSKKTLIVSLSAWFTVVKGLEPPCFLYKTKKAKDFRLLPLVSPTKIILRQLIIPVAGRCVAVRAAISVVRVYGTNA